MVISLPLRLEKTDSFSEETCLMGRCLVVCQVRRQHSFDPSIAEFAIVSTNSSSVSCFPAINLAKWCSAVNCAYRQLCLQCITGEFSLSAFSWKASLFSLSCLSGVNTSRPGMFVMLTQRSAVLRPCLVVCHFDVGQYSPYLSFLSARQLRLKYFCLSTVHNAQSSSFI